MMLSNSLVFTNNLRWQSLFLEWELKPWVHYVPVSPDFSDLEEKVYWAINNDDKAKQIADNGSAYAAQFANSTFENDLRMEVFAK